MNSKETKKDAGKAIQCFNNALKVNPNHFYSWYYKGLALYRSKMFEEAINSFDKAIEINPNHFYSWYYKGLALDARK